MKNLIALLVFLVGTAVARADAPAPIPDPSLAPVVKTRSDDQGVSNIVAITTMETVTVLSTKRPFDTTSGPGFVAFRNISPRSLSMPLTIDLVTEPVLVTLRTGYTDERDNNRMSFRFDSVQDGTVRGTEVLKIQLYALKFD
jgi:hypothetical protein